MIKECIRRRINMFKCGHINALWNETKQIRSRKPGAKIFDPTDTDKLVIDAINKDNLRTTYARAVKPMQIATINSSNIDNVIDKYPQRINNGYGPAADHLVLIQHNTKLLQTREMVGDIINLIRGQH